MALLPFADARRRRALWTDPARTIRTLEAFARTEADGGRDISMAARRVAVPELGAHLERHAEDERRHAELFRRRAAELRERQGGLAVPKGSGERVYELRSASGYVSTEGEVALNEHGFFGFGQIDELGEVAYVAMLHVAEKNAAAEFSAHHAALTHDPETRAIFAAILKDEKYHVAYTGTFLDRWKKSGRGAEVKSALSAARGSRLIGRLKRTGLRAGARVGRIQLWLLYYTLFAPVGLIASRSGKAPAWAEPAGAAEGADEARSPY